jgi:hypothetical protein
MGDIKPLGSEKLQGEAKLQRILELTYYNKSTSNTKNTKKNELVENSNFIGVFGIVKEKDGYYVKRGLNESTLDYIGGMFMKNKNKFNSYAEALKRLNLLKTQETLTEAKKYVLKNTKSEPSDEMPSDLGGSPPPAPAPNDMPVSDEMSDGGEMGGEEMGDGEMGSEMPGNDEMGGGKKPNERSEYMTEIQKFSGKLGQELRDQKDKLQSDDIKYVINMIFSAIDMDTLSDDDKDDIIGRIKNEEDEYEESPIEDEGGDDEYNYESGDESGDESDVETNDSDLGESMDTLERLINTPLDLDEISVDDYTDNNSENTIQDEHDLFEDDEEDEIVELNLDEINDAIKNTLKKYFKK